ncbi:MULTISPECIES: glycosyltransferase [unclassified Rhodanobacter]|uniref:glycosyltransferase n=1 Tax=unclassified Rhodanobacter TaxID=2621553 RepID=UPI0007A9BF5C|nr:MULTISPECIES: glycosyltransferase [unclassified Rhodanobacter]KZC18007.1 glycosyl transferase [Rhodanobacter sp. FW104-R8]KZC28160.1 glycosyl transferase [Rhodanobacter sp. FW510-T8]KZC33360.1 glycosyl transferase [Rhodanobacter sp. FW510-R10]
MSSIAVPAKLLTVVQLIPALDSGGAERSALEIARALVQAGHRSVVISAGGRLVEQLQAEGSEHVTLDLGRKSLFTLARLGALRRVLRALKPDIVHARSRLPAWMGWWALKGMTPRPHFVTTVHGLNSPGRYSAILLRGERVVAVSQTLRDYVLSHYRWLEPGRVRVIPRGIDPQAFPYGHRPDEAWRKAFFAEFPVLAEAPLLTLPGRGTRLKGHHDAIELLVDLKRRGIEARLLLLGVIEPGREAYVAELRELIQLRGMAAQVVMTPPRRDVRDIYAVSALVLQLSNRPESFGRTVIEALSLCRPVLGYAHGGVGELLAELYPAGRVPPGDRERLVERAAELLRVAPPISPLQSYRLSDMQQATLALYDEVAAG